MWSNSRVYNMCPAIGRKGQLMKEDCIFIIKANKECRALDDLYCRFEECPFYKSNKKYNLDGTPKNGGKNGRK